MLDAIRQFVNKNPMVVAGLLVLAIAGCVVAVVMSGHDSNSKFIKLNYSMDDGKTWFSGPARATPYMQDGKEVVEAVVYGCPDSDKRFVGYLRRYAPKFQAAADRAYHSKVAGMPPPSEVKRPGGTEWVSEGQPAAPSPEQPGGDAPSYAQILQVKCPNGRPAIAYAAK